jgi:hypothetical protein
MGRANPRLIFWSPLLLRAATHSLPGIAPAVFLILDTQQNVEPVRLPTHTPDRLRP